MDTGDKNTGEEEAGKKLTQYGTQLIEGEGWRKELAEVPFGELEKIRKMSDAFARPSRRPIPVTKRKTKNHPTELSSKKPVSVFKEISIDGMQRRQRDPRFVSSCGTFRKNKFRSDFAFLYDERLPEEAAELKRKLKTSAVGEEKDKIRTELTRIQHEIHDEEQRRLKLTTTQKIQAAELRAVKEGKKPFYLKKHEIKKQHLIEKYKSLKAQGKLLPYMQKRKRKHTKRQKSPNVGSLH